VVRFTSHYFIHRQKSRGSHWIGWWVGPRICLDDMENPFGTRTPSLQQSITVPTALPGLHYARVKLWMYVVIYDLFLEVIEFKRGIKNGAFQNDLYNFESFYKCIHRTYTVFWTVIMQQDTPSFIWDTYGSFLRPLVIQGFSKRALQLWKLVYFYSKDMYSVLNCHNVEKHTEFYLG
jgi:hypothetical protein